MVHRVYQYKGKTETFGVDDAPKWLKGDGRGSTMDNRWFWDKCVMTLGIGESTDTDFHVITRIE